MTVPRPPRRQLAKDAEVRVAKVVAGTDVWFPDEDLRALDPRNLDWYISELVRGEASVRRLRKRLEALRDGTAKTCPVCGRSFAGRSDAVYCDANCRLRAHREAKRNG